MSHGIKSVFPQPGFPRFSFLKALIGLLPCSLNTFILPQRLCQGIYCSMEGTKGGSPESWRETLLSPNSISHSQ